MDKVSNEAASIGDRRRSVFDIGVPENVLSLAKLGRKYLIFFDS